MPFEPRTRVAIRDTALADLAARYLQNGRVLDTSDGSDAYMLYDSLGVILELYDQQAALLANEILVDTATYTLPRHGGVEGLFPKAAVAAVLQCTVTGSSGATITWGSSTLLASDGTTYTPWANADGTGSAMTLTGTTGTCYAIAQTPGALASKPVSTVLSWSSAPTHANPTVSVSAITVVGLDIEGAEPFRARILARLRERPASGNRADWIDWVTQVDGVSDAVLYPLYHPTYGTDTLGAVTVLALGPAQGHSATNTRLLDNAVILRCLYYVEGTGDIHGNLGDFVQLRPTTMANLDYNITNAVYTTQNVELQVSLTSAYRSPWAYNAGYTVLSSPAPSATTLTLSGDLTAVLKSGSTPLPLLIHFGTAVRGSYAMLTPTTVALSSGNTRVTFVALPGNPVPTTSKKVLPGLPNFAQIQTNLFAYFDNLGPGDSSPPCRWPTEETKLRGAIYQSGLSAAIVQTVDATGKILSGVTGVLGCTVVTPNTDVAATQFTVYTLGDLSVHT